MRQLPNSTLAAMIAGTTKFQLTFTTSTNSLIERTLHIYAGNEIPEVASEIANPSKSNASAAYSALSTDGTTGPKNRADLNGTSQVTTINIRNGFGPFSSDENQNATQTIDLTAQAITAMQDGTPCRSGSPRYNTGHNQVLPGQERVENGGVSNSADVTSGGDQVVSAGGRAETVAIEAGGTQEVYGISDMSTVHGTQTVYSGGQNNGAMVGAKGIQLIEAGGSARSTTVSEGGSVTVMSGGRANGITIAGGAAVVQAGAQVTGIIGFSGRGSLEFDAPVTSGRVDNPITIAGLQAGDVIDLAGFSDLPGSTVTLAPNQLTVTNGVATETFRLDHASAQSIVLSGDGNGGISLQVPLSNTTGGASASPVAPTITGGGNTRGMQGLVPFRDVQVSDTNAGSAETVTVQVSGAGASGTLSGQGLSGGTGGTYTLAGSAATVTSELRQLVFTATAPQPNSSVTTSFTLTDVTTFGTNASDSAYSVTLVTAAAAPLLQGASAGTDVSEAPTTPFATATLVDPNANSTDTLTIGLSGGPGVLSGSGLTTVGGVYTLTGTAAQVTAALQALVFTPFAGTPGTATTTTFQLKDTTTPGTRTFSTAFSVTNTDPVVAPTISGAASLFVQSEAASTPFATATLTDPNLGSSDLVTIQASGGPGVLSGAGLSGGVNGSYSVQGTAAQVTAALQGLVFTPGAGLPGGSATTSFTLSAVTSVGTGASLAGFSVTDTDPAVAPTLTGAAALTVTSEGVSTPFATATLTDPNVNSTDTLRIQVSGAAGVLAGAGLSGGTGGASTLSGTATQVTAALTGLVFTPGVGAPGTSGTTTFTLTDMTSGGTTASDAAFSVTDIDPVRLVASGAVFNVGANSGVIVDATGPGPHTVLAGTGGMNTINFGANGGTVSGAAPGDTVTGGNGSLSVSGLGAHTIVQLGNGNSTVNLAAAGGFNSITVGNGDNRIAAGNGGTERVTAGNGANTISAGGANDVVVAGNGGDTVTLTGAAGSVTTGSGNDVISIVGVGGATIRAGLGVNTIGFAGTGNQVVNGGGTDTLTDTGSGNTIVFGLAGSGLVTIGGNALLNHDVLDLRATMAATGWDHLAGDLGSYLSVGSQGGNATIVVDPSGVVGGAAYTVGVLTGAGGTTLAGLLPHTLT